MSGSDVDNVENVVVPPPPPRPDFSLSQHTPGARITCELLNGKNFAAWSRSIRLFLGGKGKSGWLLGTITKPNATDPKFVQWEIDNCTILGWLFNSMEMRIYHVFMYHDMVPLLWSSLTKMYAHARNEARIFKLYREIHQASQASLSLSVTDYFAYLQSRWEELAQYEPLSELTTKGGSQLAILTIVNTTPMPSIFEAFAMFDGDERRHRLLQLPPPPVTESTIPDQMALAASSSRFSGGRSSSGRAPCLFCGGVTHGRDRCLKLHPELPSDSVSEPNGATSVAISNPVRFSYAVFRSSNPSWVLDSGADDHMTGTPRSFNPHQGEAPEDPSIFSCPVPLFESPQVASPTLSPVLTSDPRHMYSRRPPASDPLPQSSPESGNISPISYPVSRRYPTRDRRPLDKLDLQDSIRDALFNEEARKKEMDMTDRSESQALISDGSRERGRGHHKNNGRRRPRSQSRGRSFKCFFCDQEGHIKRNCPNYHLQMRIQIGYWIQEVPTIFCRERKMFSTYAACEGLVRMANNTTNKVVGKGTVWFRMADRRSVTLTEVQHVPKLRKNLISIGMLDSMGCSIAAKGGILRISKGNKEMLRGKKTRGLYRLEGSVQTGRAAVRHGSSDIGRKNGQGKQQVHTGTQSKRRDTWRSHSGTKAKGDALRHVRKSDQTRPVRSVQDVHRKAQRKETKSILKSCTSTGATSPKRVSFALDLISGSDLSRCVHKGGERKPRRLAKSYEGAGSEVVGKDNLKTSDYSPMGWRGRLLDPAQIGSQAQAKPNMNSDINCNSYWAEGRDGRERRGEEKRRRKRGSDSSVREGGRKKSQMEALPPSSMVKNGGMNELSHELIFSALVTGNSFWAQQLLSEPSSSHRRVSRAISAANGSRISNSDQIQSAQKWRLSIPPDSSRRDEAPKLNGVKIGIQTSLHAHQRKETMAFHALPHAPHAISCQYCELEKITPYGKLRMKDTEGDKQEDDWADQTMHWTRSVPSFEGDVPEEDISKQSLNEETCIETSERDYSGGTNERVLEKMPQEEVKRRGLKKEVTEYSSNSQYWQEIAWGACGSVWKAIVSFLWRAWVRVGRVDLTRRNFRRRMGARLKSDFDSVWPQNREDELMAELIYASILDHGGGRRTSIYDFFRSPSLTETSLGTTIGPLLWSSLTKMYAHAGNETRIFELYREIHQASQTSLSLSVADYFAYLQSRWEELAQYEPLREFTTEGGIAARRLDRQHTYQFLMGLKPEFEALRTQIVNTTPMPSIFEAFAMLDGDERCHRLFTVTSSTCHKVHHS
ncbi:hypothetical protein Acr_01g0001430 [Actinidia rufa]|uniref:CCHC-type domain-containing protein n=1 Tax=Actinidia rufa TaxID=165716 RepID=A0A7J0E1E7_9ERIC|nr:hypothetical protein Acr_01g0001430 [Actinidia rufa]